MPKSECMHKKRYLLLIIWGMHLGYPIWPTLLKENVLEVGMESATHCSLSHIHTKAAKQKLEVG